jgi:hypothetical protein
MIVCSLPRCGATRFCIDLQEKIGLPFVGELHPIHIGSSRKADMHETKYQTNFTPDQFASLIHYNKDHIILINQHSYLKVDRASFIVLRKNMRDASLSLTNFLLKMYPGIKLNAVLHQLHLMHNDHLALTAYLDKYPRDVVWYEDYYSLQGTRTPLLDNHAGREIIIKEIDGYYGTHI